MKNLTLILSGVMVFVGAVLIAPQHSAAQGWKNDRYYDRNYDRNSDRYYDRNPSTYRFDPNPDTRYYGRNRSSTYGRDFETHRKGRKSVTTSRFGKTFRKGRNSVTHSPDGTVTERIVNGCTMTTYTTPPRGRTSVRRVNVCR